MQVTATNRLNVTHVFLMLLLLLQVYILLFGVGRYETEGIYSMRAVMNNDGLPIDTIIAFESQEDAER